MDLTPMLDHLAQLEWNNNRTWFRAHTKERRSAKADFEGLVLSVMLGLAEEDRRILDYRPATLTYGLVRDTRRPHAGGPYHTAFRATIGPWGRTPIPVSLYLYVQPGDRSFLGAGLSIQWFREATLNIRDHIAANGGRWEAILSAPAFKKQFGYVQGEKLKKAPAGCDPAHPQIEYLRHKNWYVTASLPDELFADRDRLTERILTLHRAAAPFNAFLNEALRGVRLPEW